MYSIKLPLKYTIDLQIIGVALLYYAFAKLGYFLAFENATSLPTWPPSGIAFALMILLGRSVWPGITIGSLVANLMAYWNDTSLVTSAIISISSWIAVANTLEAVLGNFLVKEWIKDPYPFDTAKKAFRFLCVTMLMCAVGAGTGIACLHFNNVIATYELVGKGFTWWVGNVVGVLLFTPTILAAARPHSVKFSVRRTMEVMLFVVCITLLYLLLSVPHLHQTLERAMPFMVLPFLLWLAFRFHLVIAMSGVLITSLSALYITVLPAGPFSLPEQEDSMLLLQIFIGVVSISAIILSATVKERTEAQHKLEEFNLNLEKMIHQRTQALNDEISIRKAAEEKVLRTNLELSKRNAELDNFAYSVSHDLRAPVASVLGLINLAKTDKDHNLRDMYLDMIHRSAVQQDHFIKEILDQSRNARLEIKREEICFESLIDETFTQLKFATASGQSVEKIISIQQDKTFYSDKWRLKVILNNLISNAIRYRNGHDPVIKVDVAIEKNTASLSIVDNGRGIAEEHLPNVCKMFYRATDEGAGSGLGLYIVKEALDKLKGQIDIQSQVGRGTTVKLKIPEIVY